MPDLKKIDALHTFFARLAGSLVISMAVLILRTPNFLRSVDKEAILAVQWLVSGSYDLWFIFHLCNYTGPGETQLPSLGRQGGNPRGAMAGEWQFVPSLVHISPL